MFHKNKFLRLWLIIGTVAGFMGIVFGIVTYLNQSVLCDLSCRIKHEVSLLLVFLSLFGVFVGSLTYYFISERYEKKIDRIQKDVSATLKFLDPDERSVVKCLIDSGGWIEQSLISKKVSLSRVKVSRILKSLEKKGIICKTVLGMTNAVELCKEFKEIFLD